VQLRHASTFDAVAGVVALDPRTVTPDLMRGFRSTYVVEGATHSHVHGANLGIRASAYSAAGGWCPFTVVGEDHGLWNRLEATGAATRQCTDLRVVTSGRITSRVEGGFATDLRALRRAAATAHTSRSVGAFAGRPAPAAVSDTPIDDLVA
jgi:hypothetical protein